jgi:hypothetical protein
MLAVYLLVAGLTAVGVLLDAWTKQFGLLRFFFRSLDTTAVDLRLLQTMTYLTAGTVLGAVVISFRGLHDHGVIRGDFRPSFAGSYLLGPWASAFLGIAMYGLIRGGLFLFSGTANGGEGAEATDFTYLGLGFLIGFAWNRVLAKLDSLAAEMFRAGSDARPAAAGSPKGPAAIQSADAQARPEP